MDDKKDCNTCGNRCMDMDLDPYCAAPKVLQKHPVGLVIHRAVVQECLVDDTYTLWEKDLRSQR